MRVARQKTIRAMLTVLVLVAAALFCVACGGDGEATAEGTPAPAATEQPPDAAAVVERLQVHHG